MSIKRLTIKGLRGFSEKTNIHFAIPDNINPGSGLTVMVGPNNSGKSTVIEAVHLLSSNLDIIPVSSRNIKTNGKVLIEAEDIIGNVSTLQSTDNNGAFIQRKYNGENINNFYNQMNTFILSSKRNFSSTFSNGGAQNRENYKGNISNSDYRGENNINNNFGGRLLEIYNRRKVFDECLEKVLSPLPNWTIESINSSNLYLEFSFDEVKHSSNGAGDGYINIFNIVDALYDSSENNVILIDEPEISLHPDLQRKLFSLLVEYSKDKQIIVSTHSPYFVDWKLFSDKAKIIRLRKEKDSLQLYELSEDTRKDIKGIITDYQKPHILSLNANEIFFLNDNVILTEGQDDVLCYKEIFEKYDFHPKASFFGWGAGGAQRVKPILNILKDLGYKKVFTILDNDQQDIIADLKKEYKSYEFFAIAVNDVRNKVRDKKIDSLIKEINKIDFDEKIKSNIIDLINNKFENKIGLIKSMSTYEINQEYEYNIIELIDFIKNYFDDNNPVIEVGDDKNIINSEYKLDEEKIARKLMDKWISDKKIYDHIQKKYKRFEFHYGDGGELSFKKINEKEFYVILEQMEGISEKHQITMQYHLIVNIKSSVVKLKKKSIISNTLPQGRIDKLINKIFEMINFI